MRSSELNELWIASISITACFVGRTKNLKPALWFFYSNTQQMRGLGKDVSSL